MTTVSDINFRRPHYLRCLNKPEHFNNDQRNYRNKAVHTHRSRERIYKTQRNLLLAVILKSQH